MDDFILIFVIALIAVIALFVVTARRKNAGTQAQRQAGASRPAVTERQKIAEDIKMTQTSRVADAVAVLDELDSAKRGYRHYCELVGNAQGTGGITAPYSKREVAYYDLRCYRVDSNGETLIAHEKSVAPFYFADTSGDTRVYVDIESFGSHCILVNATDRVEGPGSDFGRALNNAVAEREGSRSWATSGYVDFRPHGPGPRDFGNMPAGFGDFFGGMGGQGGRGFGGPAYHKGDSGAEVLVGLGLGMLLSQLSGNDGPARNDPNASFRGYHIVEDVVPLGSPVYCLGEIYRNGADVHIGKSVSESYPSYYFATKPEAEVLEHLR